MSRIERMTEQELQVILAKQNPITEDSHEADEGPEAELQSRIKAHCKQKGWPCLSFPQTPDVKKFLPAGYADMVLSLPVGITLYLETKARKGIWREKQQLMGMQWNQLGHQYHVVRSFKRFLEIVEGILRTNKNTSYRVVKLASNIPAGSDASGKRK
jgi:hypothetical protein